ncbi:hypothetical protein VNI00_017561 [Paramarasmius palmivorus]|uniref:Uncharacterized protein n=1 Tax=Paramarasmius palmivorus TaxID=297713 RepID=A0AAW0B4N8_9AGAR
MGRQKKVQDTVKQSKEPEKRGNPGILQGQPVVELESWVAEYIASWRTQYTPLNDEEQEELCRLRKHLSIQPTKIDFPVEGDTSIYSADGESIAGPSPVADRTEVPNPKPPSPSDTSTPTSATTAPVAETSINKEAPTAPVVDPSINKETPAAPVVDSSIDKDAPTAPIIDEPNECTDIPVAKPSVDNDASSYSATTNPVPECSDSTTITSQDRLSGNSEDATLDVLNTTPGIIPSPHATSPPSDVPGPTINTAQTRANSISSTARNKQKSKVCTEADNILIARGATDEEKAIKEKPWDGVMKNFAKDPGKAPCHVPDFKIYEGQAEFKEKIDARLNELYGDNDKERLRLSHHVSVAQELFKEEDESTKEKVHQAAEVVYENRREDYDNRVSGKGLMKPEQVPRLRDQMGYKLQSLIDGIARATDTCISFTAAGYDKGSEDKVFFCNKKTD